MPETRTASRTDAKLARIMEAYQRAWETHDAALVVELFTEDATYQENPFGEPIRGHDGIRRYWEEATGSHRDVHFRWQLVCSAEDLHVVEWQAEFTRADSGRRMELRGVMLVELRGERVFRFREYWLRRENG